MSVFYRDIDVNISDYKSELSRPLIVYERDRGLEIYFNLIEYAYRFDKHPTNLLENLVGAYATVTLVNPDGYEISIDEVEITEDAKVKFVITEDLTDELTEIGTYQLQIHVNNDVEGRDTSVFSIPPFNFEVRERLKGKKSELFDSEGNGLTDKEGYQLVSATSNKIINFSADKINEYLNSIPTIQGKIKNLNSQLDTKTNLTNKRIEVINEKNDSKGIVDFANFSGQGNSNAPIGIVFHHYTDGKLIQIDNVGESNDILTLKNANNPNRRTDKPSEFVGNGNFLKLIKTYFNNGVKKEDDIFRINSLGQFAWTGTNTVQFSNALFEDNGMWAYKYIASPKRTYFEQKLNGDRIISEITDNGATVEFTNKQETKQSFREFSSLEFAKGGVLKTLTNVIQLITEKNDDGIWGMSFSSKNKLENFAQFQNGSEKIAIVTDKSFDFRAISFIKPLTDYEIGYLPRYSIFIREKDNALCFKDSNLEVKVINIS